MKDELSGLNVEPLLISADPPGRNAKWKGKLSIPWTLLSDEDHAVADQFGIPISRGHPKAWSYKDGFIQPAVFVYRGEEELFKFIQIPKFTNLWGAARRPEPEQVLAAVRPKLAATAS